MPTSKPTRLTRREFIKLSGATSLGIALSACGVAPTPTATLAPINAPLPTNTLAPTFTPKPTDSLTAIIPRAFVEGLVLEKSPSQVDTQRAIEKFTKAAGVKENDIQLNLLEVKGIKYIVAKIKQASLSESESEHPLNNSPLMVLGNENIWLSSPEDPARSLSDRMGLKFGIGGIDPSQDSKSDPRIAKYNTALPSVFGFTYIHSYGLNSYTLNGVEGWKEQIINNNKQDFIGFPLVPTGNDVPTDMFKGMTEDQAVEILVKHVNKIVGDNLEIREWGGVNEAVWDNRKGETGFQNYPWFPSNDYKRIDGATYVPPYIRSTYEAIKKQTQMLLDIIRIR